MIIHSFQRKGWTHDTSHKPARGQPVYNQICCVLDKKKKKNDQQEQKFLRVSIIYMIYMIYDLF